MATAVQRARRAVKIRQLDREGLNMRDIGRRVHVSAMTVSRVLRSEPGWLEAATLRAPVEPRPATAEPLADRGRADWEVTLPKWRATLADRDAKIATLVEEKEGLEAAGTLWKDAFNELDAEYCRRLWYDPSAAQWRKSAIRRWDERIKKLRQRWGDTALSP